MYRSLLMLSALALAGCPEPPTAEPPGAGAAGNPGAPPPGAEGAAGPPGEGGPAGPPSGTDGPVPTAPTAEHSQEELADDPNAVTLSGSLMCDSGAGPYHIQLYPPPPEEPPELAEGEEPAPIGPTATISVEKPGAYSLKVPKGDYVVLSFEDVNGDSSQSPGETLIIANGGDPVTVAADTSLDLDCDDDAAPADGGVPIGEPVFQDDAGPADPEATPGPDGGEAAEGDAPPPAPGGPEGGEPGEPGPPPGEGEAPGQPEPPPGE